MLDCVLLSNRFDPLSPTGWFGIFISVSENNEALQGPTGDWRNVYCCQGKSVTPFNKVTVSGLVFTCLHTLGCFVFITTHTKIQNILFIGTGV